MAKAEVSTKRLAISKANGQMVAAVAIASFITVFCLVAAHSLWGQKSYLSRVTAAKEKANTQLKANVDAVDSLVSSYKTFVGKQPNAIGGNPPGSGDKDGDNAKIILDALPSNYDFPALASSIEKIMKDKNLNATSISGTDDEVAQAGTSASASPEPVTMPFSFTVAHASYAQIQDLIGTLEKSIRPMVVDTVQLSGGVTDMQMTVTAHTYYQPDKDLSITTKVVK